MKSLISFPWLKQKKCLQQLSIKSNELIKDLPKAVYEVSDIIVEVLSHKRKAPSFAQIKQFGEDLRIEMLLKYNL